MPVRRRLAVIVALVAAAVGLIRSSDQTCSAPATRSSSRTGTASRRRWCSRTSSAPRRCSALGMGSVRRATRRALAVRHVRRVGFRSGPTATGYIPYTSSLELQGRLFAGLHAAGCGSFACLTTAESSIFSFVLIAFLAALAMVTRRSLALTVLGCALISPWVVASAHNLYWVPWTWLLPAIAACGVVLARSGRQRVIAVLAVGIATGLKAGTGYEFLTTTTLLAAGIPVIAHALGRRRPHREVVLDVVAVFVACVAGFLAVLVVQRSSAAEGTRSSASTTSRWTH